MANNSTGRSSSSSCTLAKADEFGGMSSLNHCTVNYYCWPINAVSHHRAPSPSPTVWEEQVVLGAVRLDEGRAGGVAVQQEGVLRAGEEVYAAHALRRGRGKGVRMGKGETGKNIDFIKGQHVESTT